MPFEFDSDSSDSTIDLTDSPAMPATPPIRRGRNRRNDTLVAEMVNSALPAPRPQTAIRGRKNQRTGNAQSNGRSAVANSSVVTVHDTGNDDEVAVIDVEEPKKKRKPKTATTPSTPPSSLSLFCPVCLDTFEMIKAEGTRRITATKCGHLFCNHCIENSIKNHGNCPTCREKLTKRSVRPIFI